MKNKNLIVSAAALVLLIGVVVSFTMLSRRAGSMERVRYLPTLTQSNCGGFTIREGEQAVTLRRKGGEWVVTTPDAGPDGAAPVIGSAEAPAPPPREYPADSASVYTALGKLVTMERGVLISHNPQRQEQLEVDSAKGRFVDVYDASGKTITSFIIGKSGADWNSNYVRRVGSNDVHTVAGSIKHAFFTDDNRWQDRFLTRFNRAQAQRITIEKAGRDPVVIEEVPDDTAATATWVITSAGDIAADRDAVNELLATLSSLQASEYENEEREDPRMGFAPPRLTVTVAFRDGNQQALFLGDGKDDSDKRWVRSTLKPDFTLTVWDSSVEKLDKNVDDLAAAPQS